MNYSVARHRPRGRLSPSTLSRLMQDRVGRVRAACRGVKVEPRAVTQKELRDLVVDTRYDRLDPSITCRMLPP